MGALKDLKDFYTSKFQEMRNTSPEQWFQDGERDEKNSNNNQFNKQDNIVPMLDVYLVNKGGYVSFETKTKLLEVGDRINLLTKSGNLYAKGEVKNIANNEIEVNTGFGIVRAPFDARIEPLFLIDIHNNKTNIEYGVNETITLLTKKKLGLHENYFKNRMNDFTDLIKGNKTSILPFKIGNKKQEGELQIKTTSEGNPFVSTYVSETIKNIPFPDGINDFDFTEKIKEELLKGKGIIGKINGFDYYIRFTNKSKTEKNHGNLQVLTIEKAKKFGLIPNEQKEEKKILKQGA